MMKGPVAMALASMQELPFDTFCFVVAQFLECGSFPPGSSATVRHSVRCFSHMVDMTEGKLYGNIGKSSIRRFITGEKARFGILRKAHVHGDEHYGRARALKFLADNKVFWKGMSLDLDAFIHACPDCIHHNPLRNQSVVRIPKESDMQTEVTVSVTDENPHLSEDEEDEIQYDDIVKYLSDGQMNSSLSPYECSRVKLHSKSMCLVDGGLPCPLVKMVDGNKTSLKVLATEDMRQVAFQETHIGLNGQHLSLEETQAKMRKQYFWGGMTADILTFVAGCCMEKAPRGTPVPHRNPDVQRRVQKFLKYYVGGAFPKLDTTLIASMETGKTGRVYDSQTDDEDQQTDETSVKQPSQKVDEHVMKVLKNIIGETSKFLTGNRQRAGIGESSDGRLFMTCDESPQGVYRSRKDAHRCHHCDEFISGNVAFKIHMYKHTGVKPYCCQVCGKTFTTGKSRQVHMRKHTGFRPYLCSLCGREFFRSTSFKYHQKTHNRTKSQPLPCNQCDREFLTQNRLDKHKLFKHPAVPKVYICKHCGKTFSAHRSLKWHEQSHTNPRKFPCEFCGKEFARKEYMEQHCKMTHQQAKAHKQVSVELQSAEHQLEHHLQVFHHTAQQSDLGQQEESMPQSQQLLHAISMPATSNISLIHWSGDDDNQQASRIAIADHHGGHITITDPSGQISFGDNPVHISIGDQTHGQHISVGDLQSEHISLGEHGAGQISISQDPASGHIRISQDLGSHIRISEHPAGHIHITDSSSVSHMGMSVGDQTGSVVTHTRSFSQAPSRTVHILAPSQLPMSAPSTQLQVSSSPLNLPAGLGQSDQSGAQDLHLLKQEVQYEVEVDPSTLTEDDLNAVHMLTQASLGGQNILHHSSHSAL